MDKVDKILTDECDRIRARLVQLDKKSEILTAEFSLTNAEAAELQEQLSQYELAMDVLKDARVTEVTAELVDVKGKVLSAPVSITKEEN